MSGRPFVYNIRDMYPDMALGGDIVRANSLVARWEEMHRRALREAARVIVLGRRHARTNPREGRGAGPCRSGSRWRPTFGAAAGRHASALWRKFAADSRSSSLHAGNLGFYGAWPTLLKAAELLRNENTGLVFVGDGANRAAMQASINGSKNVRFLPFRPASEIPHVMMAGDLHIITVKRGLEGVVVPSKLYSTLAAGRPILVVAAPRVRRGAHCAGIRLRRVGRSGRSGALWRRRSGGCREDPNRLAEMGRRARETAGKYARVNELEKFAAILEEAAQERPGGRHLEQ